MSLAGERSRGDLARHRARGSRRFLRMARAEHMPERVAIPGFLRGRRFVAIEADLEFFNLYEARDADVSEGGTTGRGSTSRRLDPGAVQHFRAVARSLCRVVASQGLAKAASSRLCARAPEDEVIAWCPGRAWALLLPPGQPGGRCRASPRGRHRSERRHQRRAAGPRRGERSAESCRCPRGLGRRGSLYRIGDSDGGPRDSG